MGGIDENEKTLTGFSCNSLVTARRTIRNRRDCNPEEGETLITPEIATLWVLGFYFSGGTDYRIKLGGTLDSSSWTNPISGGEEIPDATITSTNERAASTITYTYNSPYGGDMGFFDFSGTFPYLAGDFISSRIEQNSHVLNGASTRVPNSSASITSLGGSQTQPYNLEWSINLGTYHATYTMIWVYNFYSGVDSWYVVPVSQLSYQINGFPSDSNYFLYVYPVNRMSFSNQASSFEAETYLGSTEPEAFISIDF